MEAIVSSINRQKIAEELVNQQKTISRANEAMIEEKKKLRALLEKELFPELSQKEKDFLNLYVCSNDNNYAVKKTVLDTIIDNCVGEEEDQPDLPMGHNLVIHPMLIKITSDELNQNGFYYDSGRQHILQLVDSLFEKFGIIIAFAKFDYQESYLFAISTERSELV